MDKKTAKAFLNMHAPGWDDAEVASHHIKSSVDPKRRAECLSALTAHNSAQPAKITKMKAKPAGKAKPKTTTTKEG